MTEDGANRLNIDGAALARKSMEIPKTKRFYKFVTVQETNAKFCVLLDGRPVKTPGKATLDVPSNSLATMMAEEWTSQQKFIDPHKMPINRLVNSAIDRVHNNRAAVVDDVAGYANSDLLCYRAESPLELIDLQSEYWDPVLDWAGVELNASFEVTSGVVHVDQAENSVKNIRDHVEKMDIYTLSATASMTNLTGSILLALAVVKGKIDAVNAWHAAHVDEDWQATMWGEDSEAEARRAKRWLEMEAAARVATLA